MISIRAVFAVASITKRPDGRWRARYRDAADTEHARHFARKIDGQRWLDEVTARIVTGNYVDPKAGRQPLREYAEQRWLPSLVHLRATTLDPYGAHLRNHVLPALGNHPLGSIRRTDCKTFVAALSTRLAPATVSTVYAVLRSLMQSAVDDGLIVANPCARVPLPRIEKRVIEPLEAASVVALFGAMPPRYAVTVLLGAGAGLRQGEALGLLAPRVDFLRRRIHVEEQIQGDNGAEPMMRPLKTRASLRIVPVDDVVLDALTAHMSTWERGPYGLLVTGRVGRPVRRSSFGACFRIAANACGLPAGTRFHDLRHFAAAVLIAAGLHPKEIQVRLGHATIAETKDTYGHLFPSAEDSGRGAIDSLLGVPADYLRTREAT